MFITSRSYSVQCDALFPPSKQQQQQQQESGQLTPSRVSAELALLDDARAIWRVVPCEFIA